MATETSKITLQHKSANHFRYTRVNSAWFGPVRRAFEAFQKAQTYPYFSEEQFLDYILENYVDIYQNMEWITFQSFEIKQSQWKGLKIPEGGFQFRLARVNIKPDPKLRDKLFEMREKITADTGWYPLVMGSRAQISPAYVQRLRGINLRRIPANYGFILGNIVGVRNVSKKVERKNLDGTATELFGNSILLEGTKGSLLLDTGFAVDLEKIGHPRAIFLSHLHQDHIGGFWEALEKLNTFTILSDATLAYLFNTPNRSHAQLDRLLMNAYVIDASDYKLSTDGYWETFQVFHAPGSHGIVYRDPAGKAVFYPGDLCLKNGFLDARKNLFSYITDFDALEKTVLIDGTMIRKRDYSIEMEDTPKEILEELREAVHHRDVFFVASSMEASIYTFIRAFYETNVGDKKTKIVVNDQLADLTRRLIQPVLFHKYDKIDPFVRKLIGKSIINFTESHRVYPLSALSNFASTDNLIIFATKRDLQNNILAAERLKRSDVIIAGTDALRNDIDLLKLTQNCRNVRRVASPDWSFHSSEAELAEFIIQLADKGIKSVLFHSGSDNLKKWIKDQKLNPNLVIPLRHTTACL